MEHKRNDITNSLVHLTKGKDDNSGLDVLCCILNDGIIKGSGKSGFIKGPNPATCFTETPLSALKHFASVEDEPEAARYRYYGIAINKKAAFEQGARPVIYLPNDEADWIPAEQKWRHVRYEYGQIDWTYEREWRIKGNFDLNKVPGIYVICWHAKEVKMLQAKANKAVLKKIRGFLPMLHLNQML
ncbi:hypothetical protein [Alteromonas australica]|uniref:hypothetical protein n=1 Tax=Alteromonas australica TaxID=589873 RepID=UPI0023541CA0|nr:hypothetical protein [Alteromonas australica]|tara:strand:+ start:1790 stop:2347 length:558 start_codon:yes stop_codon:yes gene_type:complete